MATPSKICIQMKFGFELRKVCFGLLFVICWSTPLCVGANPGIGASELLSNALFGAS